VPSWRVRSGRRALVGLGVTTVATLVGVTLLLVSGVLGLAMLMLGWLAALLLAGVVFGVGAESGYIGWQQRPRSPLSRTATQRRRARRDPSRQTSRGTGESSPRSWVS
jgi:hypothetical protein